MGGFLDQKKYYLLLLLLALLFPLFNPGRFVLNMVILSCIWSIAALSLNLVLGYTGQASLAHGAFFGIGAYGVGLMTVRLGFSFWLALPLAALLAAAIGFIVGFPTLRTKGSYFAISTLSFGVIVYLLAGNWVSLTGGHTGLPGIPRPAAIRLPLAGQVDFNLPAARYYLVLFFLLLTLWVMGRVVNSLQGYSFMAICSNETLAESVGIDTFRHKLLAFVVANFFAAVAGGLYAVQMGALSPYATHYTHTFNFLIYLLLGGAATLAGPVIGAFAIPMLVENLYAIGSYQRVIFGILLIAVMIYFPRGLMGGLGDLQQKIACFFRLRKEDRKNALKS